MTNSDAFAELCNEVQEVYKAYTCSFHPGTNSQNIFYGGRDFYIFTSLLWSSWFDFYKTLLLITNSFFPAAFELLSSKILAR